MNAPRHLISHDFRLQSLLARRPRKQANRLRSAQKLDSERTLLPFHFSLLAIKMKIVHRLRSLFCQRLLAAEKNAL